jgi:hypothetical protein
MPDLGDLKHLLRDESKSPSDLDWLRVDKDDYREFAETLPKQNLDALTDLEEQWSERRDRDGEYNLSPINKKPEKGTNTEFWSENATKTGLSDEEKAEIVDRFARRKMTAGYSFEDTLSFLRNEFSGKTLNAARDRIKSAAKEEGLLGEVYIDSTLFPRCDQGQGQDLAKKQASDAKLVKGKDDCHDCIYNKGGVCSRFEKEIVFDVDYDQDLWNFYKKKFEQEGRDLSHIDKNASPRQKLKQAAKASQEEEPDKLDRKPVEEHPADQITQKDAQRIQEDMDVKREIVGDVYQERKKDRVAKSMMAQTSSHMLDSSLEDAIENDPDLAGLQKEAHLLGPLYVDLSYFETKEAAESFFQDHDVSLNDKVVVGSPKESDDPGRRHPLRNKKAMNRILHRYAVSRHGFSYVNKTASLKKIGSRLLDDEERLWKFAQSVFSKPLPEEANTYDTTGQTIYEPSKTISDEEAWSEVKSMSVGTKRVSSSTSDLKRKRDVAKKMMSMKHHDDNIREIVCSSDSDDVRSLKSHLHILGSLYKDSSFFEDDASYRDFLEKNAHLRELPDRKGEDLQSFLAQDDVRGRILDRLSQFQSGQLPDKKVLASHDLHGLAQEVFSRTPRRDDKTYEDKVYKRSEQRINESSMSAEYARDIVASAQEGSKKIEDFNLRRFVQRTSNGEEILKRLSDRLGAKSLKTFYLDSDGVTASKVSSNRQAVREVLSKTLDPDFQPEGLSQFPGSLTQTEVGEWLRDAYLDGKYGKELVHDLKTAFSNSELLEHAPIIASFREEEGLYGRTYVTADSFDGCPIGGPVDLPKTVQQVVRTPKCDDCIHCKKASKGTYKVDLVDKPEYDESTFQKALSRRLSKSNMDKRHARAIKNTDASWEEKTRLAHIGYIEPNKESTISAPHSGYYGNSSKQSSGVKKKDAERVVRFAAKKASSENYDRYGLKKLLSNNFPSPLIQAASDGIKKVLSQMEPSNVPSVVDHDSTNSPSGVEQLDEFGLTSSSNDPTQDIDIKSGHQKEKMEGITFGGLDFDID